MARWYPGMMIAVLMLAGLLSPVAVRADASVWMTNGSFGFPGVSNLADLPCGQPDSVQRVYVVIQPDVDIPDFSAIEWRFSLKSGSGCGPAPPLGTFWRYDGAAGACNAGGLIFSLEPPPALYGMADAWAGDSRMSAMATGAYSSTEERVAMIGYRPTPRLLKAGKKYYLMTILLPVCMAGTCEGCGDPVQVSGSYFLVDGQEVTYPATVIGEFGFNMPYSCPHPAVTPPPSGDSSLLQRARASLKATAPNQALSLCDPVPVRKQTWGSLKMLYR